MSDRTTTSREDIMSSLKHCNETPDDILAIYHYPVNDYLYDSKPQVTRHTNLDTVPNIDTPYDPGYGTQEGDNIVVYTYNYVYVKHVYDGSEGFVSIPRTTRQAANDFTTYVPVIGS